MLFREIHTSFLVVVEIVGMECRELLGSQFWIFAVGGLRARVVT